MINDPSFKANTGSSQVITLVKTNLNTMFTVMIPIVEVTESNSSSLLRVASSLPSKLQQQQKDCYTTAFTFLVLKLRRRSSK